MEPSISIITIKLGLIVFLLALSAFFSGAEASLFSLSPLQFKQLEEKGHPRHKTLTSLLSRPRQLIISILIGNETVNLAAAALAASIVISLLGDARKGWAVVIMTPILIIVGEITPKVVAVKNSLRVSTLVALPIKWFIRLIGPLRWLFKGISEAIIGLLGGQVVARSNIIKEDMVRTLADVGEREGVLEPAERELIHKVFDFADAPVCQMMAPRPDIFSLSLDLSIEEILNQVRQNRRSRIPIYKDNQDNIVGILYAKDLLTSSQFQRGEGDIYWQDLLREPYFIPWSKKGLDLFKDFQKKKIHMAVIVDEYGGIAGLVTMEDLLEEIFGEIEEEPEPKGRPFEIVAPDSYRLSSRLTIKEFNEVLETQLSDEQVDTIGGFVFSLFGQLPQEGEKVQYQNLCFEIEEVKGTRITKILVKKG